MTDEAFATIHAGLEELEKSTPRSVKKFCTNVNQSDKLSTIQRFIRACNDYELIEYLMRKDLIVLETDLIYYDKNFQSQLVK